MTPVAGPPDDTLLHAYVDGLLDPAQEAAVEALLAADPDARERVAAWRAQNERILSLVADPVDRPLPRRLRPARLVRRRRRERRRLAAAVVLGMLAGGGAGWLAHGANPAGTGSFETTLREGTQAHRSLVTWPDVQQEIAADDQAELATRLSRWLDHPLTAPDLTRFGLRLVDARTVRTEAGDPAVLVVYEDGAAGRLTLYVARPAQTLEPVFRSIGVDAGQALYWPYEELRCVLIADASPARLRAIAQAIYAQIHSGGR